MKRNGFLDRYFTVIFVVLVAVAILAGLIAWNHVWYGDWTCAFTRCVKVGDIRP